MRTKLTCLAGVVFFFLFGTFINAQSPKWKPLGPNDTNRPSDDGVVWLECKQSPNNKFVYALYCTQNFRESGGFIKRGFPRVVVKKWDGSHCTFVGNDGLPEYAESASIAIHPTTGEIYVAVNKTVYKFVNNQWRKFGASTTAPINKLEFSVKGELYSAVLSFSSSNQNKYIPKILKWKDTAWSNYGNLENTIPTGYSANNI